MRAPGCGPRWERPVSNPPDEIDAWLDQEVEPLSPPPGTYHRITRAARRRKRQQATMSAGAAVIVVAAAVALPRAVGAVLRDHSAARVAAAGQARPGPNVPASGPAAPLTTGSPPASQPASGTSQPGPSASTPAFAASSPVASGFQPTSITMVGPTHGAVLGHAACGSQECAVLAGTADYGQTWSGLTPPPAGPPSDGRGVSQVRFLDNSDGWAYGPQLFQTSDGGLTWSPPLNTAGQSVVDLETADQRAFALFARCVPGTTGQAASCLSFTLYSAPVGSSNWLPVQVPAADRVMNPAGGGTGSASLVLASGPAGQTGAGAGYVLTPSGTVLTGPLTGGPWHRAGRIPAGCAVGQAQPGSGQPSGALLASGSTAGAGVPQLVLSCQAPPASPASVQPKAIYTSADDGATWIHAGSAPPAGAATALAASSDGLVMLASTAGIDYSADSGEHWTSATIAGGVPDGGFSYVGMTSSTQGVAVPAVASAGEIFTTTDGGHTWSPHPVSS